MSWCVFACERETERESERMHALWVLKPLSFVSPSLIRKKSKMLKSLLLLLRHDIDPFKNVDNEGTISPCKQMNTVTFSRQPGNKAFQPRGHCWLGEKWMEARHRIMYSKPCWFWSIYVLLQGLGGELQEEQCWQFTGALLLSECQSRQLCLNSFCQQAAILSMTALSQDAQYYFLPPSSTTHMSLEGSLKKTTTRR